MSLATPELEGPSQSATKREPFECPELAPGIPILPPSSRHLIASRADFEERFPVRARILRDLEDPRLYLSQSVIASAISLLSRLNSLDRYVDAHRAASKALLRDGQIQAFESCSRFFESGGTEGYVKLPPRTGKTVLFIEIVRALSLALAGEKALVVVPSKFLAEQTVKRFNEFAPDLKVGVHYSTRKAIKRTGKNAIIEGDRHDRLNWGKLPDVTVIVRNSLQSLVKKKVIQPGDFKLIVIDEGHEVLGPKVSRAIDHLRSNQTWMVAFTATPKYNEEKNLRNFLGPEIHTMSIQEAVMLGMLTPFSVITAETEIDVTNVKIDPKDGYSQKEIARAINNAGLNTNVVNFCKTPELVGRSGIVFASDVNHAKDLAAAFKTEGMSCEAVWGSDEDSERERKINGHLDGSIKILVAPRLLGTGYDNPRVSFVILTVPFTSPVPVEQFSTRPLTPDPSNPEKVGLIVHFMHRDRNTRRRQLTFLDCIYGTRIERYAYHAGESTGQKPAIPKIEVSGLVVSVKPEEVLRVLDKRPDPIPPHPLDDIQTAVKDLRRKRDALLMSMPIALRETERWARQTVKEQIANGTNDRDLQGFKADIISFRKHRRSENEQSLASQFSEKMLIYRRLTQGEAIRHFDRKYEIELDTSETRAVSRRSLNSLARRAQRFLAPLAGEAQRYGITAATLASHFDSRIRNPNADDTWTHGVPAADLAQTAQVVAGPLAQIRTWEAKAGLRWDVVEAMHGQLTDFDRQLFDLENKDHTDSVISFAQARTAEVLHRYRSQSGDDSRIGLNELFGGLEPEELSQLGSVSALEILRRPKLLTSIKKFSRSATEAIEKTVNGAISEARRSRLSFSAGDRANEGFASYEEYQKFEQRVEEWTQKHGAPLPPSDAGIESGSERLFTARMLREHARVKDVVQLRFPADYRAVMADGSKVPVRWDSRASEDSKTELINRLWLEELAKKTDEVLATLPDHNRQVIKMRFGIDGDEMSRQEIANVLSIDSKRVGRIEASSIRKLQNPARAQKLAMFCSTVESSDVGSGNESKEDE